MCYSYARIFEGGSKPTTNDTSHRFATFLKTFEITKVYKFISISTKFAKVIHNQTQLLFLQVSVLRLHISSSCSPSKLQYKLLHI